MKESLRRLLAEFAPDMIVSVYPAYPHMLDEMLGPVGQTPGGKRVVVITDSLSVNAIWYRCSADYFLLPNDRSAAVLRATGISPRQDKDLRFSRQPGVCRSRRARSAPSDDGGRRVLYLINARKAGAPKWFIDSRGSGTSNSPSRSARDRRLRKSVENIRMLTACPFNIVGWSEELPRLLRTSHLLISKAGGAIVQEAMAAACPMIINHVIPGQEEGNARFLVETNCGALALTPERSCSGAIRLCQ